MNTSIVEISAYVENVGRELAQTIIERSERFGRDCFSEAAYEDHCYHDGDPVRHCIHCATYRRGGHGHVAALMSVAQSVLDDEAPVPS
jgi:hypothetical protein